MAWTSTVKHGLLPNGIVHDWFYGVIPQALVLGAEVVNSRDRFTYFDYPNFPGRPKPAWMPDLPLEKVYAFEPIPEEVPPARAARVIGAECALWTEATEEEDLEEALFPRMLAFAEAVWAPPERRSWPDFADRLPAMESALGVRFARSEPRAVPLRYPGRVETTMVSSPAYPPEAAFDGKFTRFFWSADPPMEGDSLTIHLDAPLLVRAIRLYTGSDVAPSDVLADGELHLSEDGESFDRVARPRGELSRARFDVRPVRAIRIVVRQADRRLAIREVVVQPA